jgi:hypothetical protein
MFVDRSEGYRRCLTIMKFDSSHSLITPRATHQLIAQLAQSSRVQHHMRSRLDPSTCRILAKQRRLHVQRCYGTARCFFHIYLFIMLMLLSLIFLCLVSSYWLDTSVIFILTPGRT